MLRQEIRDIVSHIQPIDRIESTQKDEVLQWIDSGAGLFRVAKPATPPMHLVSYFVLVDGDHVLLVDHKKAQRWLPTGGHVEPDEHPEETVRREELGIEADFLTENPILVTTTETVGLTAGHTDVSLWYVLRGDRSANYVYDEDEFNSIKWFALDDIPHETDPHMQRFIQKLKHIS